LSGALAKMNLPKGFLASGIISGIKKSGKKDLGLIVSDNLCEAAGVFTRNSVKAHCVIDNQDILDSGNLIKAILVNSGNANACTGQAGLNALNNIKNNLAKTLNCNLANLLTASTGVIGVVLPEDKITKAIPNLTESLTANNVDFSESILTTDLSIKTSFKQYDNYSITGIAKGSGMINPNMATMLSFIVTDAQISSIDLQKALTHANSQSFNQISVDGDTSTNDMVLILANGEAKYEPDLKSFTENLSEICQDLAKQIVKDGEGANKIIEVQVTEAFSEDKAQDIAKGIINSNLVKTAIFGCDPNWGRILAAAGQYSEINTEKLELKIQNIVLFEKNEVKHFNKAELIDLMKQSSEIIIELNLGNKTDFQAKAWGCDLSYEYVRINAEYTT
jgi:glutamate N-acetyltransferase / amino-acid N-acetyltransferase